MKINQLEEELRRKNNELTEHGARFEVLENKLAGMSQDGQFVTGSSDGNYSQNVLINNPETFKGDSGESLESFIGHMDIYLLHVKDDMKLQVAVSFLSGHAFDW